MIVRARAPLRLGLAGGGTDVSPYCDEFGGHVLNATIDKYAYAIIHPLEDGAVEFEAQDLQSKWAGRAESRLDTSGTLGLHAATYNRVVRDFNNGQPLSIRMTTFSDAPPGSGLGSSSTLVVAMLKAYQELLLLPLGDYDLAHLAFKIERIDMNLAGGRQDQYAATFGGINFMEFYANDRVIVNPLRIKRWILSELEASTVLYFTGRSRKSATIIDQQSSNVLRREADAIEGMHGVKAEATVMKEALLRGDFERYVDSLKRGWLSKKRTATSISNDAIEGVLAAAMGVGARAGKISGAGGGGFMMVFVEPSRRMDVIRTLEGCGGRVMNCHFTETGTQGWRIN